MNMKSVLLAAAVLGFTALPVMAQDAGNGSPPAAQGQGQGGGQRFEARKAQILDRLQKMEACVQAATDGPSLRACMPKRGERGGGQGGGGDQGGGDDPLNGPG